MSSRADNSLLARMNTDNWQSQVTLVGVTTTPTEMKNWADAYKFLSTAAKLWMASTDETNDVGLEITIKGLIIDPVTGKWTKAEENLALHAVDARTPVETVNTYIRINETLVKGSTPLTGILNLADEDTATWSAGAPGTGTNRVGYIAAGEKRNSMMIFSTPYDTNGKVLEFFAADEGLVNGALVSIQINCYDGFGFVEEDAIILEAGTEHDRHYEIPLRMLPQCDIKVLGNSAAATTTIKSRVGMALH